MSARRSRSSVFVEFLGSMNLAISLLLVLAVASVIGTVLEQNRPYPDYVIDFGPFWFEVFRVFNFYDVYSAGWFLAILGFLLVSTTVCLVRNGPGMIREARAWRLGVTRKSLKHSRHGRQWATELSPQETGELLQTGLQRAGYGARVEQGPEHMLIAARRGALNRWGYILVHAAIVIICFGGLLDSRMGIKVANVAGLIEPETRNLRASQIPEISRLPEWNPAFRGNVMISEGMATNVAFVNLRDGFLVQPLPFTVELREFRVRHHTTGQPKSFESDLVIHDPELDRPIERTIKVNEPLRHRGYAVYQSDFADGGSRLELKAWPLRNSGSESLMISGQVNEDDRFAPDESLRIEYEDFAAINVNRIAEDNGEVVQRNFGPSFDYRLRTRGGDTLEYRNYMFPVERNGRNYFLSGVRDGPDADFSYLYIPADAANGIDRFMRFLAWLDDRERVRDAAERAVGGAVEGTVLDGEEQRRGLIEAMDRLVGLLREDGFRAIREDIASRVPDERQETVIGAYTRVLHSVLTTLYRDLLAEEGIEQPGEAEWDFFDDALMAVNAIGQYGSGWYLQLRDFEHIEASGLQIARSRGTGIVYFGSLMLVIGLFFMFYMDHRRLWFWLERDGGGTAVMLAGSSARDTLDYRRDFEQLADRLQRGTTGARGRGD